MLENFVWEKESLRLMSRHYKDSSPISDEIMDDLIKSKNSADGCLNMRQVLFSTMDQCFHTNPKVMANEYILLFGCYFTILKNRVTQQKFIKNTSRNTCFTKSKTKNAT